MKKLTNIDQVIDTATSRDINKFKEYDCKIALMEDDETFNAYSVSIDYREALFYTEKAVLTYDINKIGFNNSLVLNNIETEL